MNILDLNDQELLSYVSSTELSISEAVAVAIIIMCNCNVILYACVCLLPTNLVLIHPLIRTWLNDNIEKVVNNWPRNNLGR